jgi:hypothetical protein
MNEIAAVYEDIDTVLPQMEGFLKLAAALSEPKANVGIPERLPQSFSSHAWITEAASEYRLLYPSRPATVPIRNELAFPDRPSICDSRSPINLINSSMRDFSSEILLKNKSRNWTETFEADADGPVLLKIAKALSTSFSRDICKSVAFFISLLYFFLTVDSHAHFSSRYSAILSSAISRRVSSFVIFATFFSIVTSFAASCRVSLIIASDNVARVSIIRSFKMAFD